MFRRYFPILFDTPGDGSGGGPAVPAGGGAPSPTPSPAPAAAPASATPPTRTDGGDPTPPARTPAVPATPAPTKYEFAEDRSQWVDPATLQAERDKYARAQWEHERLQAMVKAGTGFELPKPSEPEDPQVMLAREGLLKILPPAWRQSLEFLASQLERDPKFLDTLGTLPSMRGTFEQNELRRGLGVVDSIFEGAAKELGTTADKLTQFQKTRLGNGFTEWLEADSKLVERYSNGDATLVPEYLTEWKNGFLTIGQRAAGAGAGDQSEKNRRLPSAPRQSGLPNGGAPPKKLTEDEVHDAAWKAFTAATGPGARP